MLLVGPLRPLHVTVDSQRFASLLMCHQFPAPFLHPPTALHSARSPFFSACIFFPSYVMQSLQRLTGSVLPRAALVRVQQRRTILPALAVRGFGSLSGKESSYSQESVETRVTPKPSKHKGMDCTTDEDATALDRASGDASSF
jgi:hypothetical protein